MTRVLGVLATLLWVVGIVVLMVGLGVMLVDVLREGSAAGRPSNQQDALVIVGVGTSLVGVAGLMTAGLVLVGRRR